MSAIGRAKPDPNHHKGLLAYDDVTGEVFAVQGDAATGAVNITGTITASSDGAIVDGVSSSIKATVKDLTNSNPLATQIMDANGDAITSFGGGTQYTEGDTDASITGTAIMWEDTSDTLRAVSTAKPLPVVQTGTPGLPTGAATSAKQDTIIGHLDGVEGVLATIDGDTGNISTKIDTLAGAVSGSEMQVDVVSSALPSGAATAAKQDTGNTSLASIDGKITAVNTGAVTISSALPAGTNAIGKLAANSGVDIGDVDVTSMPGVVGTVADDGTTPGAPVMVGGTAVETDGTDPGTVSAEDDVARIRTDRQRVMLVNPTPPRHWSVSADYASAQTNTSVKASPGSGLKLYITDISISNGATAGNITLLNGSGGTVLYEIYPAINGGAVDNRRSPIVLSADTALCITSTTVTTHSVNISGYIAP